MTGRGNGVTVALVVTLVLPGAALAESTPSLAQLLERVRQGWSVEKRENDEREARFRREKEKQASLLDQAKRDLAAEETRSADLEKRFAENEGRIAELEADLAEKLGTLGEAFGVVRQVAGDTNGVVQGSIVSAQIPGRGEFLERMGRSKELPTIENLRRLWFELLREITEGGRVVRFTTPVLDVSGEKSEREVVRVGTFNAVADGKFLTWNSEIGMLVELGRQPAARHLDTVDRLRTAKEGLVPASIDPTRGVLLSLLVQTPGAMERIQQGGVIGYVILALGLAGGLVAVGRLVHIMLVSRRVRAQQGSEVPSPDNPLGRVLAMYREAEDLDSETLELRLDEAILRESARLDRFQWVVKTVSVVAPLLGLLGTVTGMIQTFQAIQLFGTGDPKLMAGGISEALVTTMLGLCVAVPLVLLHAWIVTMTKRNTDILEEQSAGLVALRAETRKAANA